MALAPALLSHEGKALFNPVAPGAFLVKGLKESSPESSPESAPESSPESSPECVLSPINPEVLTPTNPKALLAVNPNPCWGKAFLNPFGPGTNAPKVLAPAF